jgi:predicted dehydrogenase
MNNMLVIGLGSMGKRRLRNLAALGIDTVAGVDRREDRRKEVAEKYGIPVYASLGEALENGRYDRWFISVPPDAHHIYIEQALSAGVPCFVEASVIDTDFDTFIKTSRKKKVLVAPSCTLRFHPAIRGITKIIQGGELGTVSNVIYHSGQYLPDWHTYEKVSDYYVSNRSTGGAREIVPFELTWITDLFGFPKSVTGIVRKTIDIPGAAEIDDTYNILMDYNGFIFNLTVDVVSRYATRRLLVNGSAGQLVWNWEDNGLKVFDPVSQQWETRPYEMLPAQEGYNKNITEGMYIEEIRRFLEAADGKCPFPNSLDKDKEVLHLLYAAEESYTNAKFVNIS